MFTHPESMARRALLPSRIPYFWRQAMSSPASDAERWLPAAQAGSKEALAQMLEACRGYLLLIATQELDPALRAKGGASDLVQETILEAFRDFGRFQGGEEELLAWLR